MEKKLNICESVWEDTLLLEKFVSKVIFFDSILLEFEYNLDKSYEILGNKESYYEIVNTTEKIEKNRIYISNRLYGLFFTYRGIFLRIYNLYHEGKKNKNIVKFSNDNGVKQHLKSFITDEIEINFILSKNFGGLAYINDLLKNMILEEIKKIKAENNSLISIGTNISAGGDIIVGENNKNLASTEKQEKNWQNSYVTYLFVSILLLVVGGFITYTFTNYQENKKNKDEFILNYQELTQVLIPYLQVYSCTKLELKDDISRQEFINKNNKINDILLKLKKNFKEIDSSEEVANFPKLLDEQIIAVKVYECKDYINKKNNLDIIYNKIID